MIPPYAPSVQDWMRQVAQVVNPAIFNQVGNAPVAGSVATINWLRGPTTPAYPATALGGLWPSDKVTWDTVLSAEFNASNAPVGTPLVSPAATLMIAAHNTGCGATVCSLQTICGAHASNIEASGVNFITYADGGLTGVNMKGLEIDLQPAASTGINSGFGLALNAFTKEIPGDAIYIEGVFGGNFTSGIRVGKLSSSNGAGIYGTGAMGSLVDTATGTYSAASINVQNTHRQRFMAASGNHAQIYVDASNFLKLTTPGGGLVIRNGADTTTTLTIGDGALGNYASDAAAATGGVSIGQMYRNGSALMQRIT